MIPELSTSCGTICGLVGKLVSTSKLDGSIAIGMGAPDGAGVGSLVDGPGDGARLSISAREKVGKGDCGPAGTSASEAVVALLGTSGQASRVFAEALGLEKGWPDRFTVDGNAEGYPVTKGVGVRTPAVSVVDTVVFVGAGADRALMVATVPAVTPTAATVAKPTVVPTVAPAAAPIMMDEKNQRKEVRWLDLSIELRRYTSFQDRYTSYLQLPPSQRPPPQLGQHRQLHRPPLPMMRFPRLLAKASPGPLPAARHLRVDPDLAPGPSMWYWAAPCPLGMNPLNYDIPGPLLVPVSD